MSVDVIATAPRASAALPSVDSSRLDSGLGGQVEPCSADLLSLQVASQLERLEHYRRSENDSASVSGMLADRLRDDAHSQTESSPEVRPNGNSIPLKVDMTGTSAPGSPPYAIPDCTYHARDSDPEDDAFDGEEGHVTSVRSPESDSREGLDFTAAHADILEAFTIRRNGIQENSANGGILNDSPPRG